MKKIYSIGTVLFAIFFITSCDIEEYSENPNVPDKVPLSTLLPPTQKALADVQGGRIFTYSNIFSQQLEGVDGQEAPVEIYNPNELSVGNVWSDLYVDAMINLRVIIDQAAEEESPHYAGVARVLLAQSFGILTDVWGDVPYSQALNGADFPSPAYDSQEFIYGEIMSLLDNAIVNLEQQNSVFSPGSDDIIFGGDLNAWLKAARALKARYSIHLTKRSGSAAQDALDAINSGAFLSSNDDMIYPYLGTGTDINPISSFYSITPYAYVDADFVTMLQDISDPRLDFLFKLIPFSGGNRKPGDYFSTPAAPFKIMSYLEQLFIAAEANFRLGNIQEAQNLLEEAVSQSMNEVSFNEISETEIDDYVAAQAQLGGTFEEDLKTIITQKYIALFTTMEPWTDYRRTGYPELAPNPGGVNPANPNGEIPRRLIYPQSERLRNENFPSPAPTMQDRFWWDQ